MFVDCIGLFYGWFWSSRLKCCVLGLGLLVYFARCLVVNYLVGVFVVLSPCLSWCFVFCLL